MSAGFSAAPDAAPGGGSNAEPSTGPNAAPGRGAAGAAHTGTGPPPAPRFDLPEPDAFTRPYWDAAAEGRLLIRRCAACVRAHHYPREFCPHCWSEDVAWEEASGDATLYTWSVVHRNDLPPFGERVPYTAAVVDLAEGPRMMTELVDGPTGDPHHGTGLWIGMPLRAAFRAPRDGAAPPVPVFQPLLE